MVQAAWGLLGIFFRDPDLVFWSEEMRRIVQRYCTSLRTTVAESPWQHGHIERWHQTTRRLVQVMDRGLAEPGKFDIHHIVDHGVMTRN